MYGFMLYNAFREKVSSRKRKKRGNEDIVRFDIDNYKEVRDKYSPQLFLMLQHNYIFVVNCNTVYTNNASIYYHIYIIIMLIINAFV